MNLSVDGILHHDTFEYVTLDGDLRITGMSRGAALYADDPPSVVIGGDIRAGFPEFVGAETELRDILQGRRCTYTVRGISREHARREPFYVTVTAERSRNDPEAEPFLVIMLEDVTEWMKEVQRRTQTSNDAMLLSQAITAAKVYIENIFDAMADMLIVTSAEGTIDAVNRATLSLTGYTTPELIGRPITMLLPDECASAGPGHDPMSSNAELRCVTKMGTSIPVEFSRAPLDSPEHVTHGVVYIGRDLRQQKEASERISKLEIENLSLHQFLNEHQEGVEIVWSSPAMGALMKDLSKVAATETTVLISGETGTGKELIARAIHGLSNRRNALLVNVNCAALPSGLVESELFGHEKGAFTGAVQRRIGRFELADGGTVFLDEVGELPPATQAKLLRVLQEQEFERVGGSQAIKINVRVVAATNRDLANDVREGRFREDLLFRLNVFPLRVPPLRDRKEDIPLLTEHFIELFSRRTNKRVTSVSPRAMQRLIDYTWPGNVRELANIVERAMIVCEGDTLETGDLALLDVTDVRDEQTTTFDEMARQHLLHTLDDCGGVIEGPHGAAARLGLKPATLRSRMKKLGLVRTGSSFGLSG